MVQADAAADGISFDGEPDETALKPNPNIPGVPNWEIEDCRGQRSWNFPVNWEILEDSGRFWKILEDSGRFWKIFWKILDEDWKILDEDWKNWMIGAV